MKFKINTTYDEKGISINEDSESLPLTYDRNKIHEYLDETADEFKRKISELTINSGRKITGRLEIEIELNDLESSTK